MPGLLRGIARTAVISGTATAVSNNVSRRQAQRWAEQERMQPGYLAPRQTGAGGAQAPAAAPSDVDELTQLAQLHEQGILTDEEFAAKKKQVLGI